MTEEKLREANVLSHGIKEMVESIHELEENREHILAPDKMRPFFTGKEHSSQDGAKLLISVKKI